MLRSNLCQLTQDRIGHDRTFAERDIDMDQHPFAGGGDILFFAVIHGVEDVNAFGIIAQQLRRDLDRRVHLHFAQIEDVPFRSVDLTVTPINKKNIQPDKGHQCIAGMAKGHAIIAIHHVPIIVDPLRLHDSLI